MILNVKMKRCLLFALVTFASLLEIVAVRINGLNYNFLGQKSAQVVSYHMITPFDFDNDPIKLKKLFEESFKSYKNGEDKKNYSGVITIPEYVTYKGVKYSVTSIDDNAFKCCSITSVTIPSSIDYIKSCAFYGCSGLTSITLPQGVVSLCRSAFADCTGLTSVTIPYSVTFIDGNVFSGCSNLTSIKVEEGNYMFDSRNNCNAIIQTESNTLISGCQNTTIPKSVTSIGEAAFRGCSGLTSITIPKKVKSISRNAFSGCDSLVSIKIESGNPIYDSRDNCNAIIETKTNTLMVGCKNTVIPNSVTSIGVLAFEERNGLTSITIPEGVTSISVFAFEGCRDLTTVSIPSSVINIGEVAFHNCTSLKDVYCYSKECPPIKSLAGTKGSTSDVFNDSTIASATLHVPAGTVKIFKAQGPWSRFGNIVEMEEEVSETAIVFKALSCILLGIVFVLLLKRLTNRKNDLTGNYHKSYR